jgi:hypothetical protein
MVQAILLSIAAGLGSALLSGVLSPLSPIAGVLFIIAPLPLLIAGLGWHPLVAALGALIACVLLSMGLGHRAALAYGVIVGLPAWLLSEAALRLFARSRPASVSDASLKLGGALLGGIAAISVAVGLFGALSVSFEHEEFQRRLTRVMAEAFRALIAGEAQPPGLDVDRFARLYVGILPPVFAVIMTMMLTLSLWLAMRVARLSDRLPFEAPPLFLARMPREALFVYAGCFALAQTSGWLGYIGLISAAAMTFCFTLTGLAVMHFKTLGRGDRPFLLSAAWFTIIVFGLTALIFTIIGALDAFFDFRRLGQDGGNPKT